MTVVWVTGAHGFIGRHVAAEAARGGAQVAGIGHGTWREGEADAWRVSAWVESSIDIAGLDLLAERSGMPDTVYHLAGGSSVGASLADPQRDYARTVTATAALLHWIERNTPQARVIAASSAAVYGVQSPERLCETDPLLPSSPYGMHKCEMERLLQEAGIRSGTRSAVVRLFSVYGEGLTKQLLWELGNKVRAGNPICLGGTGAELRDWVHISDVARLMTQTVESADPSMPIVNGGRGEGLAIEDVARLFRAGWGAGAPPISFSGECREGDPARLVADASKLDKLGFTWRLPPQQGIPAYAAWHRSHAATS